MDVPDDFFVEIASADVNSGRFAEAAICIVNARMFDRFDCHQLCFNLVDLNKVKECKLVLSEAKDSSLINRLIETLSTPKHAKTATKLILDYELEPGNFPALMTVIARNNSIFFISRVFKRVDHSDYMPLYQVEDLLSG